MRQSRLKGLIWGGIIGDAVGVPYEFRQRDAFTAKDMVGYGTYQLPPGTWSDDTSMTLCTLAHLNERSDIDDLMQKFVNWYQHGYMTTPEGTFDIGIQTSEALLKWSDDNVNALSCGATSEHSNGNGALMRIAPILLRSYHTSIDAQFEYAKNYACVTHGHPRSILASWLYLLILEGLLDGEPLAHVLVSVEQRIQPFLNEHPVYKTEFEAHYHKVFQNDFKDLSRDAIASSGYVVDTFQAMIWCALNSDDYEEAVLTAVNLGDDTDTIASLVGQLIGLSLGFDAIPKTWVERTRSQDLIEGVLTPWINDFEMIHLNV